VRDDVADLATDLYLLLGKTKMAAFVKELPKFQQETLNKCFADAEADPKPREAAKKQRAAEHVRRRMWECMCGGAAEPVSEAPPPPHRLHSLPQVAEQKTHESEKKVVLVLLLLSLSEAGT
jgi:hypothetical protein